MKISLRITLMMTVMTFAGLVISSGVLIYRGEYSSEKLSRKLATVQAQRAAEAFGNFLGDHWKKTRVMVSNIEAFEAIPVEGRRNYLTTSLGKIMGISDAIIFAYITFDENELDGGDAARIGQPGTDSLGRFRPMFSRSRDGVSIRSAVGNDFTDKEQYIKRPRESGRQVMTDPFVWVSEGEARNLVTIGAPIRNSAGRIVGVAAIGISLDKLQWLGQSLDRMYTGTRSAAFTGGGVVVSHFDSARLMQNVRDFGREEIGAYLDTFLGNLHQGIPSKFDNNTPDGIFWFSAVPITISDSSESWGFVVAVPRAEALAGTKEMILFSVITVIVMIAIAIALGQLFSARIAKPLVNMAKMLNDIAYGEGDLTVKLPEEAKDETGAASKYFNQTISKIRDLIISIKSHTGTLSNIGEDLGSNMAQTASAMNQITANIQSIKSRIINQSASVSETNATMEQVTVNIDKLNGQVERQTSAVSLSSSAIEQMIANIKSVSETLAKNAHNVKELKDSSELGRSSLHEVAADIQEIARESEGLLEINAVMENIASQTNLLSMNAAIEAAHAGEAGKGFAVVADEIRKLAESSSEQSRTIATVLKKIKESIDKITRSTANVLAKFEKISAEVKTVARQEENIRSAMEEQSEGSRQILSAAGQVNEITLQVKGGSAEMLEGSREVIEESRSLEKATQEITCSINEMASGADEINAAVHNVNELSHKNRESISRLVNAVSRFKV